MCTEAEFFDEIRTKVLRVVLLAIHSHLLQLCLEISISSNSRNLLQFLGSVKEGKEEKRGKTDSKPYLLPYGLRNLKKCTFMNSASANER